MDTKGDESSPGLSPHRQVMDRLPPVGCHGGPFSYSAAPSSSSRRSETDHQSAWSSTPTSERREARLHELCEQVQNGTYRVSAEHIAEKMLLDTVYEQLA